MHPPLDSWRAETEAHRAIKGSVLVPMPALFPQKSSQTRKSSSCRATSAQTTSCVALASSLRSGLVWIELSGLPMLAEGPGEDICLLTAPGRLEWYSTRGWPTEVDDCVLTSL